MSQAIAANRSAGARPNFRKTPKHTIGLTSERVHRVETRHGDGSQLVEDLTASFADERTAALVQRTTADALDDGLTVEDTRAEVKAALLSAFADEFKAWYRDEAYLTDLDRAIDIFTERADRDRLDAKLADLRVAMAGVL